MEYVAVAPTQIDAGPEIGFGWAGPPDVEVTPATQRNALPINNAPCVDETQKSLRTSLDGG
jgi:hypothetical protein